MTLELSVSLAWARQDLSLLAPQVIALITRLQKMQDYSDVTRGRQVFDS